MCKGGLVIIRIPRSPVRLRAIRFDWTVAVILIANLVADLPRLRKLEESRNFEPTDRLMSLCTARCRQPRSKWVTTLVYAPHRQDVAKHR